MEKGRMKEEASGSGGGSAGIKRKKVYNVEPRTPLKRQRIPVTRFQSPVTEEATTKPKPVKEEIVILYKKNTFLAVRGAENTFYLCKTQQNVNSGSRQFRIQWLNLDQPPNIYKMDYIDHTDIECVLTNVRMERIARDTFRLPHSEQERAEKILQKAMKAERGEPIEDELEEEVEDMDVKEEKEDADEEEEQDDGEWEDEPTPKKRNTSKGKGKGNKPLKIALSKGKKSKQSSGQKKKDKDSKKKEKKKVEKKKSEKKKGPDRNLRPNPKIKVQEKNLFFETKENVPFTSVTVKTRQVLRAAILEDKDLLKSLMESDSVYKMDVVQSIQNHMTAVDYAIQKGSKEILQLLLDDIFSKSNARTKRVTPTKCILGTTDTGHYNQYYLGVRRIRALNMSRGSREGNDAFTKDVKDAMNSDYVLESFLKKNADPSLLDHIINKGIHGSRENTLSTLFENIYMAVELGHRKIAAKLATDAEKTGGYGFNFLHAEVLRFEKEDLRTNLLAASVRKKPYANIGITPLHCSAINPNVKYITRLLQVEPDINLMDKKRRRPIHYAAACEGSGPLELLLERGASPDEVDTSGVTALHFACSAGRAQNVDVLLKKAKLAADAVGDVGTSKWGIGGVNRSDRFSVCPMHAAIFNGHADVVKTLIKHGANLNKQLSAGKDKKSPLMLAAERGYLGIARLLVQNGATVELLDKFKRSALTHAIMNGNSNVASYLLYLGADPNRVDSSGNTLVHYAAAYGWPFCLKMLINDADADPTRPNDWKTTPIAVAFMKGHMGLVDYLLNRPGVDINFKDDEGMTLTSLAVRSRLDKSLVSQVEYLVKEKNADPSIPDLNGSNSLHHLAANSIKVGLGYCNADVSEEAMDTSVTIAKLLVAGGCDPAVETEDGKTAVLLAIKQLNSKLVRFLVENGGTLSPKMVDNENVLHMMAKQCMSTDLAPLIEILADQKVATPKKLSKKVSITSSKHEEAMEVDEPPAVEINNKSPEVNENKTATINGEKEVEKSESKKVDEVERMNGDIGDEPMEVVGEKSVLKIMAAAVDGQGMTPFLRACHEYKNFTARYNMNQGEKQKAYQQARDFIRALIDLGGSDINKYIFDKEHQKVQAAAIHMMVETSGEPQVCRDGQVITSPGLALLLRYKPNLEARTESNKSPLYMAVGAGSADKVTMLIKHGADVNAACNVNDKELIPPIICAAMNSSREGILTLLIDAKANVNARHEKSQSTPLHYVVERRCNEEIIDKLLKAGADLNAKNSGKYTPFHLLVRSHSGDSDVSLDLEEFLIDKGADVFAKDESGRLPLHYVFTKLSGSTSEADPIELCSLLTTVMKDMKVDDVDSCGRSPLHYAAQRGATICCMHLLQRKAELSRKDIHGNTPLSLAVQRTHDSCAIMLIQRGASVRDRIVFPAPKTRDDLSTSDNDKKKRPEYKWRPLSQWAAKPSTPTATSFPVYQGALRGTLPGLAHIIIENTGTDFSAVECALSEGKCNIALRLMKRIPDPSRLQAINEDGQNLFHILVFKVKICRDIDSVLKVAQMLRDKGVPVGLRDKFGLTPLQYAAIHHENKALAKFLIDNDPALDLKMKDKLGRDVLCAYMWDVEHVDVSWLEMLLNKGASLDVRFDRPLPDSLLFGSLVVDSSPDYFTMKGDIMITPVILAIHYSEFSLLKFMLSKGASPSFDDSLRRSPLMHAVVLNDLGSVKLLLNHSYDPNQKTQEEAVSKPTPVLQKQLSRAVFMLRPDGSVSYKSDVADEDTPEEKKSEEEDLDAKDDAKTGDDIENDKSSEDAEVDGQDEDGEEDDEVPEEDSDHDTDVMEEEEEQKEKPEKQMSILSKQLSLRKGPSKSLSIDAYPTVDKTSSVELDAVDNQGWTVLHHLVSPLEFGTYDDEAVLVQLARGGATLDKKDNAGLSALDYALIRGAPKIASRLQKLLKVEKVEKPTFSSFEMSENLLNDGTKVDFRADCEKMMEKLHEDENSGDVNKIVYEVDSFCKDCSSSELVQDKSQDIPYDVLLSKVDVSCGTYGMYNFYKMQLTFEKNKQIYVLFTRWGRIGDQGQYQHTPYQKKEEAVKEYCKIFRTKTGNDWSKVGSYVNHPKKYRLVHRERKYAKVKKVDLSLTSDLPCKLPQDLQDVVKEMSSDKMLQASLSRIGMNVDYMPFGHIKKDCLLEAKNILTQLGELIEMVKTKGTSLANTDPEQYEANYVKISKLSNDYYHLVPSHGFEYEAIRPITNMTEVKDKLRFLFNILDIEIASRILIGSQMRLKDMTPLDYIYRSVNCQIESLPPDSIEAQYILGYVKSADTDVNVRCIYKLTRPGEEERLKALNMENHRLLWHGSSMSNFLSILHRGLLIAPPEAPITGHLFGEGIYFSDSFKKSRNYCSNHNPDSSAQLLLLSQVALGKCKEARDMDADDMLDPEINSLKVYGREEPSSDYDVFLPYGAVMPMGRMTSVEHERTSYMPYNEYVIFNPSQICLRYLILVSNQ